MKAKRGRPKTVFYSRRTLIQINDNTMLEVKALIKNKMSIAEFFRHVAQYALDNPDIIKK